MTNHETNTGRERWRKYAWQLGIRHYFDIRHSEFVIRIAPSYWQSQLLYSCQACPKRHCTENGSALFERFFPWLTPGSGEWIIQVPHKAGVRFAAG
jgi:hypothetical protein